MFPTNTGLLLVCLPVICTDWILETADPLSAVQLLPWLGWKVIPGAHPDTVTSLCSAEFTPCLLCCCQECWQSRQAPVSRAAGAVQGTHLSRENPKCSQARSGSSHLPQPAPFPSTGISPSPVSFWNQAPGMGVCSSGILTGGAPAPGALRVLGKELMLPLQQLCWPGQDSETWRHSPASLLPSWEHEHEPRSCSHTQLAVPRHALAAWPSAVPARLLSLPDTSPPPWAPNKAMAQPG